ncbi:MAG: hypothetical protein M3248_07330 [Actinomycetota bacterium]|nr:hypothetical protein [Actinomycetota bacterium]
MKAAPQEIPSNLRVGHLLRINGYLDMAIFSMWAVHERVAVTMGMVEASVRGAGPGGEGGPDEEFLAKLRDLIGEAREYYAADDFQAAMARMRVAEDLIALRIIRLAGG